MSVTSAAAAGSTSLILPFHVIRHPDGRNRGRNRSDCLRQISEERCRERGNVRLEALIDKGNAVIAHILDNLA